jgi:hypothetical protein
MASQVEWEIIEEGELVDSYTRECIISRIVDTEVEYATGIYCCGELDEIIYDQD